MVLVTGRRGIDLLCSSGINDFATDSLDRNRQQHEIYYSVTKYSPAPLMLYDDQRSTPRTSRMISRKVRGEIKNGKQMEASGAC